MQHNVDFCSLRMLVFEIPQTRPAVSLTLVAYTMILLAIPSLRHQYNTGPMLGYLSVVWRQHTTLRRL
jgi:hypothetical protein